MRAIYTLPLLLVLACGDNKAKGNPDAAPPLPDSPGMVDAMPDGPPVTGPDGIGPARAAADGTGLSLPINGVTITYIKPQIGSTTNDPAGFTIQAEKLGPALFVSVDPATLTPVPVVGDVVSFTITTMGTVGLQRRAQEISGLVRNSQGANVGALAQEVSALTDLTTAEDNYDSEIVTITGTVFENFVASGQGFQKAAINTVGITGDVNLEIRAPATVVDAIDMVNTCQITATNIPVGRFNAQTQLGAYNASDLTLTGCPAPTVVSAIALSSTTTKLTFSRNVLASSVTADGSQFTFDNGLLASAATVSGRTVTVTTGTQTVGTTYTVTVANTVTDLQNTAVAAPGTGSFAGFLAPAVVRINEVNGNITNGCDLIELRVIAAGSMTGFKVTERTGNTANSELNFTFPTFVVAKNDIVVVHANNNATCNPGNATAETTSVIDEPLATHAGNFDTAFDFWVNDGGLVNTSNVITLFDATGTIADAVFVTDTTTAAAGATLTAAGVVGTATQWAPPQATYTSAEFIAAAVDRTNLTSTTVVGTSIQRVNDADTNAKADWTTGAGAASTFGLINVGQTPQ